MSIEISGKPTSSFLSSLSTPERKDVKDETGTSKNLGSSTLTDTVNVTSMAKKINELVKKISSEPIVDTHRINSIRNDIEHGSYVVNTSRVAEKFFRFEFALHR